MKAHLDDWRNLKNLLSLKKYEDDGEIQEKIASLFSTSLRINLDVIRKSLRMQQDRFNESIPTWAKNLGLRIEDECAIKSDDIVDPAITNLEQEFAAWQTEVKVDDDKKKFLPPFEAYKGPDPFVFISYAHLNSNQVYRIINKLNDAGIRIWYDEGIPASDKWRKSIAERIMTCKSFIVFLSPEAIKSENVLDEIALGEERFKKHEMQFLPIYLSKFELDPELKLSIGRIQAMFVPESPDERFFEKLIVSISSDVKTKAGNKNES
nr:toll/interleukin-1 receptor domain-containing protein [Candidatus Sigynarchaeota archaeon]